MSFILLLAMTMLAVVPAEKAVSFKIVENDAIPQSLIDKINNCDYDTAQADACRKEFLERNNVWSGDVNGDGSTEFLVHPRPAWGGSGGYSVSLYREDGGSWRSLFDEKFMVNSFRFQLVSVERQGYKDLRIGSSGCYRWDGEYYVMCSAEEYGEWRPDYFDQSNWFNAKLFWEMRYRGRKTFKIEPRWFDAPPVLTLVSQDKHDGRVLKDSQYGISWVVFQRRGVWGVKGNRAFLLTPVSARHLKIVEDWLLIEHFGAGEIHLSRYNRRTGRLEREAAPGTPVQKTF